MIYRYEVKNVYYAGINYASRVEGVCRVYNQTYHSREDAWSYEAAKNEVGYSIDHLIYRGIDISKCLSEDLWDIAIYTNCWEWRKVDDWYKWRKERYLNDL